MAYICVALAAVAALAECLRVAPGSREAMQAPTDGRPGPLALPYERSRSACPSGAGWHSSKGQSRPALNRRTRTLSASRVQDVRYTPSPQNKLNVDVVMCDPTKNHCLQRRRGRSDVRAHVIIIIVLQ